MATKKNNSKQAASSGGGVIKAITNSGSNISKSELKNIIQAAGGSTKTTLNQISGRANLSSGAVNSLVKQLENQSPNSQNDLGESRIAQTIKSMLGTLGYQAPRNPQSGAPYGGSRDANPGFNPGGSPNNNRMIGGTIIRPNGRIAVRGFNENNVGSQNTSTPPSEPKNPEDDYDPNVTVPSGGDEDPSGGIDDPYANFNFEEMFGSIGDQIKGALSSFDDQYKGFFESLLEDSKTNTGYIDSQIKGLSDLYDGQLEKLTSKVSGLTDQYTDYSKSFNDNLSSLQTQFEEQTTDLYDSLKSYQDLVNKNLEGFDSKLDKSMETLGTRYDNNFKSLTETYDKAFANVASNLEGLSSNFNTQLGDVTKTFGSQMDQMRANTESLLGNLNTSFAKSLDTLSTSFDERFGQQQQKTEKLMEGMSNTFRTQINDLSGAFSRKFSESELNYANQIRNLQRQNQVNNVTTPMSNAESSGRINRGQGQFNRKQLATYGVNV